MKIKAKNSRRRKSVVPEAENVTATAPDATMNVPPFTPQDLSNGEAEKPKRSYTRRKPASEMQGISFGKLLVFAGETASKLSSLITKQDAPLNQAETEMLNVVGDTCGKFLIDENQLEEVAPKYAKYAVIGVLGLVVGVRALDYFMRPRLTAGKAPSIAYDVVPEDVGEHQG